VSKPYTDTVQSVGEISIVSDYSNSGTVTVDHFGTVAFAEELLCETDVYTDGNYSLDVLSEAESSMTHNGQASITQPGFQQTDAWLEQRADSSTRHFVNSGNYTVDSDADRTESTINDSVVFDEVLDDFDEVDLLSTASGDSCAGSWGASYHAHWWNGMPASFNSRFSCRFEIIGKCELYFFF
jgi:hypothetical protein